MLFLKTRMMQRVMLAFMPFVMLTLLAACSVPGMTASPTPTPTPKPTPSPTPTQAASLGQTFTGKGYSISYPTGWTQKNQSGAVLFQDALGNTLGVITVADADGALTPTQLADTTMSTIEQSNISNAQATNVPATTSLAGETWQQRGATGTGTASGVSVLVKLVLIVTVHPANSATSQAFEIFYLAPDATFDLEYTAVYSKMLATFKFTS